MSTKISHRPHRQMSESFLTAGFLSLSGGLQDAYTYMSRGKVFANAQTGNIVLLSQSIGSGDWPLAIHYLVPLLSFALGVAAAELIRQTFQNIRKVHWRQLVLIIEIFLLFFVGFMPDRWNLMANAMVSFSCAMQVQAFRKVNGYGFASTMCIGNMRSAMESVCAIGSRRAARPWRKPSATSVLSSSSPSERGSADMFFPLSACAPSGSLACCCSSASR